MEYSLQQAKRKKNADQDKQILKWGWFSNIELMETDFNR